MRTIMIVLAACLMTACTMHNHISGSWVKKDATTNSYNSVIVVALVGSNHPGLQQDIEEDMVDRLTRKGYHAVSSYDKFGSQSLDKYDEKDAVAQLQGSGLDEIMTIVLLDTQKEANFTPGSENYGPIPDAYKFYGYYSTRHHVVFDPGYYTMDTHYFWETNLYAARSQELLYSARTESFEPASTQDLADKYNHTVLRDMIVKEAIHPR